MGWTEFFEKQKSDEAGVRAVKLQKAFVALFGISLFRFLFALLIWVLASKINYEVFVIVILWAVYSFGFFGAYGRSTQYLLLYMIIMTVFITLSVVVFIFAIVGGLAVAAGLWDSSAGRNTSELGIPVGVFLTLAILVVILDIASLILEAFTVNWSYKLRKIVKKGRRFSSLGSVSMEDEEDVGYRPPPPPPDFELDVTPPPPPQF
eukprot:TRINITY_DN360_c0_g6_i1.p1 TRINITY_DN360_c0_g6~~TRINITY_DN360_c0_g6_i1.p1  ORF type:complete len:206 (+),score=27.11 TRINITY_DN360_c0_g6_i1:123-740(+)